MNKGIVQKPLLVLDSWPILEWLKGREPASSRFESVLHEAKSGRLQLHMSRMNRGEVLYSIQKTDDIADCGAATGAFLALPLFMHSLDDPLIDQAANLKSKHSFAYADAFAAALASRLDTELVTGDKEFKEPETDGVLKLRWAGP